MTMFVDDYVRQVERACADLPDDQRRRLIADLAEHLREVDTATGSVYAELGPPDEYARELRVALDLPPAPPQYSPTRFFALSGPDRRSGWTVLGATIVLVVLVIVIAVVVNRPGSSRSFVPTPIASAPASQASAAPAPSTSAATSTVLMPSVVGGSLATARARLERLGLLVQVRSGAAGAGSPGTITEQTPGIGSVVPAGTTVTLTAAG